VIHADKNTTLAKVDRVARSSDYCQCNNLRLLPLLELSFALITYCFDESHDISQSNEGDSAALGFKLKPVLNKSREVANPREVLCIKGCVVTPIERRHEE
jgi:hypothetical protein